MRDIRKKLLPAFIFGHSLTALIHSFGLLLLLRIKFKPANQRTLLTHLSFSELCYNLHQVTIFMILWRNGRCDSSCEYVDYFCYLFFAGTNKLIMIYLICDRLLDIQLSIKYPLYFTEERVRRILLVIWFCCGVFSLVMISFWISDIARLTLMKIVLLYMSSSNIVIIITALVTYIILYLKVRHFRHIDRSQRRAVGNDNFRVYHRSKFLLPCLLIATYLLFNSTADVMILYKHLFINVKEHKTLTSEIAHWFWVLAWISDGVLYILLQKDIRNTLRSIMRKRQSAITPTQFGSQSGISHGITGLSFIYSGRISALMH